MDLPIVLLLDDLSANLASLLGRRRAALAPLEPLAVGRRSRSFATALVAVALSVSCFGQGLSDTDVQAAINAGLQTPPAKLWKAVRRQSLVRMNRAGLDPIEKKILMLSDADRISLEAAEATRQMRTISVEDVRQKLPMGAIDVMLEANCYNNLYNASLPKWGSAGGVHLVLVVNSEIIQPIDRGIGNADAVSILPQQHAFVSASGGNVTDTPLYRTAFYERDSLRTWFTFPALPSWRAELQGDRDRWRRQEEGSPDLREIGLTFTSTEAQPFQLTV